MKPATIELQKNIRESKDALQALADELRVKVHLAGLDAKDEWRKLEPQVAAIQAAASIYEDARRRRPTPRSLRACARSRRRLPRRSRGDPIESGARAFHLGAPVAMCRLMTNPPPAPPPDRSSRLATHRQRRVVLTGGPGAGKTAALEVVRAHALARVQVLPEAASIVFGGGFPRRPGAAATCAAQRAIFRVQEQLERLAMEEANAALVLCDRGTLDGLAYWPAAPDVLLQEMGTSMSVELAHYDTVIHLRTPTRSGGFDHANPLRIESAAEALRIDARIEEVWAVHPRRFVVDSTQSFIDKVARVLALVAEELSLAEPHAPRAASTSLARAARGGRSMPCRSTKKLASPRARTLDRRGEHGGRARRRVEADDDLRGALHCIALTADGSRCVLELRRASASMSARTRSASMVVKMPTGLSPTVTTAAPYFASARSRATSSTSASGRTVCTNGVIASPTRDGNRALEARGAHVRVVQRPAASARRRGTLSASHTATCRTRCTRASRVLGDGERVVGPDADDVARHVRRDDGTMPFGHEGLLGRGFRRRVERRGAGVSPCCRGRSVRARASASSSRALTEPGALGRARARKRAPRGARLAPSSSRHRVAQEPALHDLDEREVRDDRGREEGEEDPRQRHEAEPRRDRREREREPYRDDAEDRREEAARLGLPLSTLPRRCGMTNTTSVCVASDSTNHPVWNAASDALRTCKRT